VIYCSPFNIKSTKGFVLKPDEITLLQYYESILLLKRTESQTHNCRADIDVVRKQLRLLEERLDRQIITAADTEAKLNAPREGVDEIKANLPVNLVRLEKHIESHAEASVNEEQNKNSSTQEIQADTNNKLGAQDKAVSSFGSEFFVIGGIVTLMLRSWVLNLFLREKDLQLTAEQCLQGEVAATAEQRLQEEAAAAAEEEKDRIIDAIKDKILQSIMCHDG